MAARGARYRPTIHSALSEPYEVGDDHNTFNIQLSDRAISRTRGAPLKIPRCALVPIAIHVNGAEMRFFVNHPAKDGSKEIIRPRALLEAFEATFESAEQPLDGGAM